jgi:ArsR family transcriptional regulator, arsenate/arsenite/antimonite-responsive transcriptional repressor
LKNYVLLSNLPLMTATADVKADLYRALAHPLRLRVLELLQVEERSARDLQTLLEADSGAMSQHLSALRRQGLVEARRQGTTTIYKLADARIAQLLDLGRQIISTRLTAQHAVLQELAAERVPEP